MHKVLLQGLISDYDKNDLPKNPTIQWLKEFMGSEEVGSMNDEADIRFADFVIWMNKNVKQPFEKHFSQEYLKSGSPSAQLFEKFIDGDDIEKELTKSKSFRETPPDYISEVPRDVLQIITHETDAKSLKSLSQTSHAFFLETKRPEYWRKEFIQADVPQGIIDEVIKLNLITNFTKLYVNLRRARIEFSPREVHPRIIPDIHPDFATIWCLICVSDNPSAIIKFIQDKKIPPEDYHTALGLIFSSSSSSTTKAVLSEIGPITEIHLRSKIIISAILSNDPDTIKTTFKELRVEPNLRIHGMTPLHIAAIRDKPDAIKALAELRFDPDAPSHADSAQGMTALHFAAESCSTRCIETLAELVIYPEARDSGGMTALHFAALSGDTTTIKAVVGLGLDPKDPDHWNLTALHYAVRSLNPAAIKTVAELGFDTVSLSRTDGYGKKHTILDDCINEWHKGLRDKDCSESILLIRRLCFECSIDISASVSRAIRHLDDSAIFNNPTIHETMKNALRVPVEEIPPTGITLRIEPPHTKLSR